MEHMDGRALPKGAAQVVGLVLRDPRAERRVTEIEVENLLLSFAAAAHAVTDFFASGGQQDFEVT